jgi:hypothetical protein
VRDILVQQWQSTWTCDAMTPNVAWGIYLPGGFQVPQTRGPHSRQHVRGGLQGALGASGTWPKAASEPKIFLALAGQSSSTENDSVLPALPLSSWRIQAGARMFASSSSPLAVRLCPRRRHHRPNLSSILEGPCSHSRSLFTSCQGSSNEN